MDRTHIYDGILPWMTKRRPIDGFRMPRFGIPQGPDYKVYDSILRGSIPDKLRDEICAVVSQHVGAHREIGDDAMLVAPNLHDVRILQFFNTMQRFRPTLMEKRGPVIVYFCVSGSMRFEIQKGRVSSEHELYPGDILVILTTDYPGEDSLNAVRHGWFPPRERDAVLVECTDTLLEPAKFDEM